MLTHTEYVQLQLDATCLGMPPTIEVPNRGDMAGVVTRVVDGDSIMACALLNIGSIRVHGIDAPEMGTAAGKRSKQFAEAIIPLGRVLLMRLQGREKFGRVLGDIQLPDGDWLAETMTKNGYAKGDYHGGKRD